MTRPREIAVVGAGAAGTLTATRLLHHAALEGHDDIRVTLIGPGAEGRGLAFGTPAEHHLLNVPAQGMSAHRDDPGHFVRWLDGRAGPTDFVPRGLYGRYLGETLEAARGLPGAPGLLRVPDRVTGLAYRPGGAGAPVTLRLDSGRRIGADAVVLALGNFAPDRSWAPPRLRDWPGFVADPWAPGALGRVPDDGDVLLVGTGLTMVDVALTVRGPGRVVHAVSRHGLVPQPHADHPVAPHAAPRLDAGAGLTGLRRAVLRHVAGCRRAHGDWRCGVDSLRPVTSALWQQLSEADRARFLREDLRLWETHRHRVPPVSARALAAAVDAGLVSVGEGTITGAEVAGDAIEVALADGRRLRVRSVVNCTGAQGDLTRVDDPLVVDLLASGLATPAPLGGLVTSPGGRVHPVAPLWTLGSLRRGALLETTAIPEIRCQADDLAGSLLRERAAVPVA
ncbi:FAD/NAD(P)-binding protein [Streptantibioticus cattleyicolor]|uniref:HI0933 family protein n=1 Tax=Streptantibioticus cattleyicolor (strain ATCC 35852 / DSM 46488 / JCM 4925 / NBRC 14057 / NRRL 8057) TaxID=1003195 RepID=F8JJ15_STREN|nr:FAD/NAD(P)-binding protein [Streptantibioticus cattleyicolor]AEW98892.1 HI0933 family protein [Streptantibioticus cattleyicolor NRRL 8057 = DSM 46488]CCB72061.1 conserved protein of unknown function [Streptantibioticus cattleyicolor NRRL 8057 = DSM 46488]